LNDTVITQVLERHPVSLLTNSVQIALAKGERPEVAIDDSEKLLCCGKTKWHVPDVKVLHVVTALAILDDVPAKDGIEKFSQSIVDVKILRTARS